MIYFWYRWYHQQEVSSLFGEDFDDFSFHDEDDDDIESHETKVLNDSDMTSLFAIDQGLKMMIT